jgi:hypothetical protein
VIAGFRCEIRDLFDGLARKQSSSFTSRTTQAWAASPGSDVIPLYEIGAVAHRGDLMMPESTRSWAGRLGCA